MNPVHTRRIGPRDADLVARIQALATHHGPLSNESADLHFALGNG